jgi:hypothetical protein
MVILLSMSPEWQEHVGIVLLGGGMMQQLRLRPNYSVGSNNKTEMSSH